MENVAAIGGGQLDPSADVALAVVISVAPLPLRQRRIIHFVPGGNRIGAGPLRRDRIPRVTARQTAFGPPGALSVAEGVEGRWIRQQAVERRNGAPIDRLLFHITQERRRIRPAACKQPLEGLHRLGATSGGGQGAGKPVAHLDRLEFRSRPGRPG